jgi:tight adherence protein B
VTGVLITVLLFVSALLLTPRSGSSAQLSAELGGMRRRQPRQTAGRTQFHLISGRFRSRPGPELQDLPLLLHQLTGLLVAGRAPHQLWADAAALQRDGGGTAGAAGSDPRRPLAGRLLPVLEAAAQAASLGLSPVPVFRSAAASSRPTRTGRRNSATPGTGGTGDQLSMERLWSELAACVSVSERSGAPLAGVLGRYAAQLEGGLDQQASRETAMAGPRATVRLLTWLPVGGLALGYVLGADPLAVLAGSPLGWLAAAAGLALALMGRVWSRTLVRQAAGA